MPWLYYERNALQVIQKSGVVKFRASFGYENLGLGIVSKLRFKVASYDIEGNFLGFDDLFNQLIICKKSNEEIASVYRIGKDIDISCTFDLSRLTSVNQYEHPNYENRFFELYLVDWNDDLIDVPILITSILSETG